MNITKKGTMIRMGVDTLRVMGRATQGVRLITLRKGDEIASIAKVPASEEEEEIVDVDGVEVIDGIDPTTEATDASSEESNETTSEE